jgi:hypothetical protein
MPFGIAVQDSSVNFQDNIRKGLENDGIPTQFLNDTASCRIWYEPGMYLNVTSVWERTAAVAFGGKDGAMDQGRCVRGSVSSREQQSGGGTGNPGTNGTANGDGKKKDAAVGVKVSWMVMMVCGFVVLSSLSLI